MQYFILGIAGLALGLYALGAFSRANSAILAGNSRRLTGAAVLAISAVLFARGGASYAVPLASLGIWLIWGASGMPWGNWPPSWPGSNTRSGRPASTVRTEHLEMELEHESGAMRGRVLKGAFAGRDLDSLRPVELAQLWQDCRFADPQSAQLIEAFLDRVHPSWRDDMARAGAGPPPGSDGPMTRAEAFEILGLSPDASPEAIRQAHRALMQKMHPDRGGSTYLAAKINEAKDVALGTDRA